MIERWDDTDIFMSPLINSQVHSPKRPTTNLLTNGVLIDSALRWSVVLAALVGGSSIWSFLYSLMGFITTKEGRHRHTLTGPCFEGVRLCCLRGLGYLDGLLL